MLRVGLHRGRVGVEAFLDGFEAGGHVLQSLVQGREMAVDQFEDLASKRLSQH